MKKHVLKTVMLVSVFLTGMTMPVTSINTVANDMEPVLAEANAPSLAPSVMPSSSRTYDLDEMISILRNKLPRISSVNELTEDDWYYLKTMAAFTANEDTGKLIAAIKDSAQCTDQERSELYLEITNGKYSAWGVAKMADVVEHGPFTEDEIEIIFQEVNSRRITTSPSAQVSDSPSETPSTLPSILPSVIPSTEPSVLPSVLPSTSPSTMPSMQPSILPTTEMSISPSPSPSIRTNDLTEMYNILMQKLPVINSMKELTEDEWYYLKTMEIATIEAGGKLITAIKESGECTEKEKIALFIEITKGKYSDWGRTKIASIAKKMPISDETASMMMYAIDQRTDLFHIDQQQIQNALDNGKNVVCSYYGTDLVILKKSDFALAVISIGVGETKEVVIPDSIKIQNRNYQITEIGELACEDRALVSITIGKNVKKIGKRAFLNCTQLKQVIFTGDALRTLGVEAFADCKSLKQITLPDYVSEIPKKAFYRNESLTSVSFGKVTKSIGDSAFEGCKKLKTVTITNKIQTIGKKAFANCTSLKSVTVKSTKLKKVGKKAFMNIKKGSTIKLPKAKKTAYTKLLKNKYTASKTKLK